MERIVRVRVEIDRSTHGLGDQDLGDAARKTEMNARINHRLHEQEDVGRAGAREGGRHVEEAFLVEEDLVAEGRQDFSSGLLLCFGYLVGGGPHGDSFANLGRCVRHRPDNRIVAETTGNLVDGGTGHDRKHHGG